jgi:hypothetical protein
MSYQPPKKYTEVDLIEHALADLKTDLKCALRDNMPLYYTSNLKKKIIAMEEELDAARANQ